MKYKLTINYEYIEGVQEQYDELIEDGYLPDEAEKRIESNLRELASKISGRADNTFWDNDRKIKELKHPTRKCPD